MARIRTIKPEFAAEVRGFFFGEGHIDLVKYGKTTRAVSPRVRIALREDDKAILLCLREYFGGSLTYRAATRSWCWQLTGKNAVLDFATILNGGQLPSKKKAEASLLIEACHLIPQRGEHHTDASVKRLLAIRDELKAIRYLEVSHG